MDYKDKHFCPLRLEQAPQMFALVAARVAWLEQQKIDQWNRAHYLAHYNLTYFERAAQRGQLWGLLDGEKLLAGAVLLTEDERWQGYASVPAWYVHNLAADPQAPGAGAAFLRAAEQKARELGKQFLRLDCKAGAEKINRYYQQKGFHSVGEWGEGVYRGTLREKKL